MCTLVWPFLSMILHCTFTRFSPKSMNRPIKTWTSTDSALGVVSWWQLSLSAIGAEAPRDRRYDTGSDATGCLTGVTGALRGLSRDYRKQNSVYLDEGATGAGSKCSGNFISNGDSAPLCWASNCDASRATCCRGEETESPSFDSFMYVFSKQ